MMIGFRGLQAICGITHADDRMQARAAQFSALIEGATCGPAGLGPAASRPSCPMASECVPASPHTSGHSEVGLQPREVGRSPAAA